MSFIVVDVTDTAEAAAITDDTNSPTEPAAASLLVVVPIMPEVELKLKLVAEPAPKTGVTKVGEVVPAKLPVPDAPDNPTLTWLFVAT
jgi:hypothetical protein